MLRRIDRLVLRVPNLSAAVKFWRDVHGLAVLRQDGGVATLRYPDGGAELVLHTDADLPGEAVYHLVDDVRDLYRRRDELRLKFAGPPARVARGYRATVRDPFDTVLLLIDRTLDKPAPADAPARAAGSGEAVAAREDGDCPGPGRAPASAPVEDGRPARALFPGVAEKLPVRRDALAAAYEKIGRTADDLPYTVHFERLYAAYADGFGDPDDPHAVGDRPDRAEVWRHLLLVRKKGGLPKLGAARSKPPKVDPDVLARLEALLGDWRGRRDRLPYTPEFDRIAEGLNATLPRRLPPHLIWRLVAGLAK